MKRITCSARQQGQACATCYMSHVIRRIKNFYHLVEAFAANVYYGFPSRKLKVIGVTGTDGKTTTTHLICHILNSVGIKTSMISSIGAQISGSNFDTGLHITTPSSFAIQKLLRKAVNEGNRYFVIETTAHGLDQNRIWGINYSLAVLTNVTHEHLNSLDGYDYFRTYENYLCTKTKLLLLADLAIINKDDQSYNEVKKILEKNRHRYVTYSLTGKADYCWHKNIKTNIAGEMNKSNIMAAYAVAKEMNIDEEKIIRAINTFSLPEGRLDVVFNKGFMVIVDFAHTINGLNQVLRTVKENFLKGKGKLIHVFGSAGLRDVSKRKSMGRVSGKYADIVILTEEDYRTEDPYKICEQIGKGLQEQGFVLVKDNLLEQNNKKIYTIIVNRKDAIKKAISIARKNDLIILTGKGHEKSLCRGKIEYPWDEKAIVLKTIEKLKL